MKIKCWQCDKCGKEFRDGGGSTEIPFLVDVDYDQVDGRSDNIRKWADLCTPCQRKVLDSLIGKLSLSEQAKLAKELGAK